MITDYATLKAAIANWLARADLTSAIPEFIQLAETRINRTLFVRERMTEVTGTTEDGQIALPSDYDRMISLRVQYGGGLRPIYPVVPGRDPETAGVPSGYTLVGSNLHILGQDDTEYALTYYARIPSLSDTNTQNWLLAKEPGLYLYGALIEASPYLRSDDRTLVWAQQYASVLGDLQANDDAARYAGAAQRVDFNAA